MLASRPLVATLVKHVAKMGPVAKPQKPLVAVIGSTGTGKSDLAVDLAVKFNGEIINADAMQMYQGMPIITNQLTTEEQRGIPHHLLATIGIDEQTWTVNAFARKATQLIEDIRSRGKLPIVVGGTHYYVDALLFGNLVNPQDAEGLELQHMSQLDAAKKFPILDSPTDLILRRLREVDPAMAARWHPGDRRRIKRSLEIFLTTGKRASDIYAERQKNQEPSILPDGPWENLMFWVYAEPDVLLERLDGRVDKMVKSDLIGEITKLYDYLDVRASAGEEVDRTRGIWQAIGFKQFEPYITTLRDGDATQENLSKLKGDNVELMKIATRQYATYQRRWLRTKTIPALQEQNALSHLYLLDSSDAEHYSDNVLRQASDITKNFLAGSETPDPLYVSQAAKKILSSFHDKLSQKQIFQTRFCDICNMTLISDNQWNQHVKGNRHRRGLKHKSRTSMVAVQCSGAAENSGSDTTNG